MNPLEGFPDSHRFTRLPQEVPEMLLSEDNSSQAEYLLKDEGHYHHNATVKAGWKSYLSGFVGTLAVLMCTAMFFVGLRWRMDMDRDCMKRHSFYCMLSSLALLE